MRVEGRRWMKVALLGLGVMGQGMAGRLLAHGHALSAYNRTPGKAADLEGRGARIAGTPREAAEGAEVVITMVANDAALRQVAEGADGFLAGLGEGAIALQMSHTDGQIYGFLRLPCKVEVNSRLAAGAPQLTEHSVG